MIDPRELRIGNLVLHGDYIVPVSAIMGETSVEYRNELDGFGECVPEILSPIPLTAEWLERAGFEWLKMPDDRLGRIGLARREFTRKHSGFKTMMLISMMKNGKFLEHNSDMIIKHLHQLQNLYFALTGEELEIKMP